MDTHPPKVVLSFLKNRGKKSTPPPGTRSTTGDLDPPPDLREGNCDPVTLNNIDCFNALAYADDIVLLCPTKEGLRKMIEICEAYAIEYDLLLNGSKSKNIP